MGLAALVERAIGGSLPVRLEVYDGSRAGPADAPGTLVIRRPEAFSRMLTRPGELGLARAYVAGDVDLEGDLFAVLESLDDLEPRIEPRAVPPLLRALGPGVLRPLPPPPEEARLSGRLHSKERDRRAVTHHYDVSNAFYRLVLGPTLTYSCAVFESPDDSLEVAQTNKYDLICRKLGLQEDQRLLDVGCGWGGMLLHAATTYGVIGVGVTLSREQAELATKRVAEAGLTGRIDIRVQDYRDVRDGPFDAISSIGMFEHVGRARMEAYMRRLHALLRPGGRLLNHAISRPGYPQPDTARGRAIALGRRLLTAAGSRVTSRIDSDFMQRYVFPDGELHEVGVVVSMLNESGFEVRHVENLREHYALTLRRWVANLEEHWDEAVAEVGVGRARVWRLYMAASAVNFERGNIEIHQVLAVRPDRGRSGMPLRPSF
ncbi:MAG: cyclopropane-fatty-acyl-phospholipid synthase family protein [Acidimicrobiales bacterium]